MFGSTRFRPIAELVRRVGVLAERVSSPFRVLVVVGGAGGVELAFTLWQRLGAADDAGIRVRMIHAGEEVLAGYPKSLIERVHRNASSRGIEIVASRRVVAVHPNDAELDSGEREPFDALIWVSGAVSHPLFAESKLPIEPLTASNGRL